MTHEELIDAIVTLDIEEAEWYARGEAVKVEISALQAWGELILERRRELLRRLRREGRTEELRTERGF